MKITVLGSTGMLGNTVGQQMIDIYGENNVYLSYRNKDVSYGKNKFYYNVTDVRSQNLPECDYLINCIGVIKPFMELDIEKSIYLNSIFPIQLADICTEKNIKLIHITTDCVFSGKVGGYNENALHDALDDYGKSKSLGEVCKRNSMLLRTSIIGKEIHKKASLLEWAISQKGKDVKGFTNHFWNGVTTKQYAKICSQIIDNDLYENGLFHVFSDIVDKYELMHLFNEHFKLDLSITAFETEQKCDRTLSTIKELKGKLQIPGLEQQISEL